jgi:hypothetical protein
VLTEGTFVREDGQIKFKMGFTNVSQQVPVTGLAIQFNKNSFGLAPTSTALNFEPALVCVVVCGCGRGCVCCLRVLQKEGRSEKVRPALLVLLPFYCQGCWFG